MNDQIESEAANTLSEISRVEAEASDTLLELGVRFFSCFVNSIAAAPPSYPRFICLVFTQSEMVGVVVLATICIHCRYCSPRGGVQIAIPCSNLETSVSTKRCLSHYLDESWGFPSAVRRDTLGNPRRKSAPWEASRGLRKFPPHHEHFG